MMFVLCVVIMAMNTKNVKAIHLQHVYIDPVVNGKVMRDSDSFDVNLPPFDLFMFIYI